MLSIRKVLQASAQAKMAASPDNREFYRARHEVVRGYFEERVSLSELRQAISGAVGNRLVRMTDPDSEDFALLMSAFDILLDEAYADRLKYMPGFGMMTVDDYVAAVTDPAVRVVQREQKQYGF